MSESKLLICIIGLCCIALLIFADNSELSIVSGISSENQSLSNLKLRGIKSECLLIIGEYYVNNWLITMSFHFF